MAFAVRRADRLVCFYLSRSPQHKGHTRFVLFFLSVSFRILRKTGLSFVYRVVSSVSSDAVRIFCRTQIFSMLRSFAL